MTPRVKRLSPKDYEDVERQIAEIFRQVLFEPLYRAANEPLKREINEVLNASSDELVAAIRAGRIRLQSGVFTGQFSAKISSSLRAIGARFDSRTRSYKIDPGRIPPAVQAASQQFNMTSRQVHQKILGELDGMQRNMDTILSRAKVRYDRTINKTIADFRDVARLIGVHPELDESTKQNLAQQYNLSTKLPIKRFMDDEIVEIRSRVEANSLTGGRFEGLVDMIRDRYSVSINKAKFLARQETALFTAKFQENRFAEAGITKYKWSTSHDERVRPQAGTTGRGRLNDHRSLDGREFFFSSPPIVDRATGRRANPGEDYNCRCVAIPVLNKASVTTPD